MSSGITYYANFKDLNSINNPLVGSNTNMLFGGFWSKNETGDGIVKKKNGLSSIYCNDASILFSLSSGYVGMTLSFPFDIADGVYVPLNGDTATLDEYILWGINVGQYEVGQPSLYASLTPRGIEFTIFTAEGTQVLRDTSSNITANTDVLFEFLWTSNDVFGYMIRTILRVDDKDVDAGNTPISSESISGLNFYVLNTPSFYSNMECTIRELVIWNRVPDNFIDFLDSSSSSSSLSSFSSSSSNSSNSSSSNSSSSSSSYIENWSSSSESSCVMSMYIAGQLLGDTDYYRSLYGDGTYIYTISDGLSGHLRAYTFNGSSFSLSGSSYTSVDINATDVNYIANANPSIGNNIITADSVNGIRAYSFNGSSFTYKAVKNDGGQATNIFTQNDNIYLANGTDGLRAYYLWYGPFGFNSAGNAAITGTTYAVGGDGTYIYAGSSSGLRAYSQNGLNLTLKATDSSVNVKKIWCDGTYIYVNDATSTRIKAYTFNGTSFSLVGTGSFISVDSSIYGDGRYIYFQHSAEFEAWTFDNIGGFVFADNVVSGNSGIGIWSDGAYVYNCGGVNSIYPVNGIGWECIHL